jgi:RimJ/RimL family protein N-acetyltransferase
VELAPELAELLLDPEVYPWLWDDDGTPTRKAVLASAAKAQAHWERFGFGLWLLRDRDTGEVVGRGGLRWTGLREVPGVEVGWAIVSGRWGEGLATELALESIRLGFDELEVDELVTYTRPGNAASIRVMEKTGFAYDRDLIVDEVPQVLYRRGR